MKDSSVNWNTRLHCQVSFIKYEVKNHSDSWTTYCSWFTSHHQTVDTTWPSGLTLTLKPWTLRWRSTFRHFSSLQINNFLKCPTLQQCVGVFFVSLPEKSDLTYFFIFIFFFCLLQTTVWLQKRPDRVVELSRGGTTTPPQRSARSSPMEAAKGISTTTWTWMSAPGLVTAQVSVGSTHTCVCWHLERVVYLSGSAVKSISCSVYRVCREKKQHPQIQTNIYSSSRNSKYNVRKIHTDTLG